MPFGVLGLPAVLAFFPAFGFALARLFWPPDARRILAFAFGLTVSEWLRGHLFTGFPWNNLGMALGQNLWLMQAASLVGLYGLTLLEPLHRRRAGGPPHRPRRAASAGRRPALALGALLAAWPASASGGVPAEAGRATCENVRLRIMQPNLPQDAKFNPRNRDAIMRRYLALSASPGGTAATLRRRPISIWPESAFPFLLHRDAGRAGPDRRPAGARVRFWSPARRAWTSRCPGEAVGHVLQRDPGRSTIDGTILGSYDKVHLVPFGEYVPRRSRCR